MLLLKHHGLVDFGRAGAIPPFFFASGGARREVPRLAVYQFSAGIRCLSRGHGEHGEAALCAEVAGGLWRVAGSESVAMD